MKKNSLPLISAVVWLLSACANFPEVYENVIEGEKIRPFAIRMEPAEAAPGDTVHVTLLLYDAGKDYAISWSLALNFTIDNYSQNEIEDYYLDLDSMAFNTAPGKLEFDFQIPVGGYNPILLSGFIPEVLIPPDELNAEQEKAFEDAGIALGPAGATRHDFTELMDGREDAPASLGALINETIALIRVRAHITSPGFMLDVTKNLTVRYNNRFSSGIYSENVNENPFIKSAALIQVHQAGIEDPDDISAYRADTQYFTNTSSVDTFSIRSGYSYFLMADTSGVAQQYRSRSGILHTEQLWYQWFYTNKTPVSTEWDELITLVDQALDLPVVCLRPPKNKSMREFAINVVVRDWRPEWAIMNSNSIGFASFNGYFKYAD